MKELRQMNKEPAIVGNFADSVAFTHLANAEKHIRAGSLLDWGKKKYFDGF